MSEMFIFNSEKVEVWYKYVSHTHTLCSRGLTMYMTCSVFSTYFSLNSSAAVHSFFACHGVLFDYDAQPKKY